MIKKEFTDKMWIHLEIKKIFLMHLLNTCLKAKIPALKHTIHTLDIQNLKP